MQRRLQKFGSRIVELAGAAGATDETSGFRAHTREAALNLIVINRYMHTVESTIQAGLGPLRIIWVPIKTNPKTRESRLIGSMLGYVRRNARKIIRVFAVYCPMRLFGAAALLLAIGTVAPFSRSSGPGCSTGGPTGTCSPSSSAPSSLSLPCSCSLSACWAT